MKFSGVILADDLGMGALARRIPGKAAIETLRRARIFHVVS